jgi:hypothetical protein
LLRTLWRDQTTLEGFAGGKGERAARLGAARSSCQNSVQLLIDPYVTGTLLK